MVQCLEQAFEDMNPGLCFAQLKDAPAGNDLLPEIEKGLQEILQSHHSGPAVVNGKHIQREGCLQVGELVKLFFDHFRLRTSF